MNRRGRVASLLGALFLLVLVVVAGMPASGNDFEGSSDGPRLKVTPSDDLPPNSLVTVEGAGLFVGTVPGETVQVAQCVSSRALCGTSSPYTLRPDGGFLGKDDFVAVRYLTLIGTRPTETVDCAELAIDTSVSICDIEVNGGGSPRHHLTFSTVVPTTMTVPKTTTTGPTTISTTPVRTATTTTTPAPTTTTTRDLTPAPGVTIPPTTRVTVRPTTTRPAGPTTVAPSTTTTTVPPPPGPGPVSLIAVTTRNQPAGPPGSGLQVKGDGYTCSTVYFFFDGTRVGSTSPDASGHVSKGGLSVPGDAGKGPHRVAASCEAAGGAVVKASTFEVLPVSVHRPAFVTSLPLPSQVSVAPRVLLASAALAMGAIMLIAFPFELFNSTMEENYDEIRGWFGIGPRVVPEPKTRSNVLVFFAMTAVTALACGFLSPDFGLNRTSGVLFLGIFVALIVMAVIFSLPADIGIRRQFGEWGKLNFLPGSVIVTVVMVAACRLFNFQPGFFYGALAGLAFRSALSEPVQGKMTAYNWLFSLFISVGAFFVRVPVSSAASQPGSSIWWIGLEICLSLIFLWGVEGLAVAMLPMRFLDGRKVFRWSRTAWAVLFFLGMFATIHVLLRPGSGYVGSTSGAVGVGVMSLFAAFGLGSVAFWAYFRFRPSRWVPARL